MTEIWRDIPGYKGKYQVSNIGRVKSLERRYINSLGINKTKQGKVLKLLIDSRGYPTVHLYDDNIRRKVYSVHRLVAYEFIENQYNKPYVNHIDGIKTNNHYTNLEWVTPKENARHALDTGLSNTSGQFKNKISDDDIIQIRDMCANSNLSRKEIANIFGVSSNYVYLLHYNKRRISSQS